MSIKIRFLSPYQESTGTQMLELDGSFDTFAKVMAELLRLYPPLRDKLFGVCDVIDPASYIMLNQKRLSWPADKDVWVGGGDELLFMILVAGG